MLPLPCPLLLLLPRVLLIGLLQERDGGEEEAGDGWCVQGSCRLTHTACARVPLIVRKPSRAAQSSPTCAPQPNQRFRVSIRETGTVSIGRNKQHMGNACGSNRRSPDATSPVAHGRASPPLQQRSRRQRYQPHRSSIEFNWMLGQGLKYWNLSAATLAAHSAAMAPRTRRASAAGSTQGVLKEAAHDRAEVRSKVTRKRQQGNAGTGAAVAEATGFEAPPRQHKRASRSPKENSSTKGQPLSEAAPASGSSAEAGTEVPRGGKRQRKQAALPPPAALCFSPTQDAVRIGTSGYRRGPVCMLDPWRPSSRD